MSISALRVRPADVHDCRLLWEWANDPDVRRASFDQAPIPWDDHVVWFDRQVRAAKSFTYIVEGDGIPCGQVRFDIRDGGAAEVDLSIARPLRGRGLASESLRLACEAFRRASTAPIVAHVRPENRASLRTFEKAGFASVGQTRVHGHQAVRLELRTDMPIAQR